MTKTYAIYTDDGRLAYLGIHEDAKDAWRIYLGWPTKSEVDEKLRLGYVCRPVVVTPESELPIDFTTADGSHRCLVWSASRIEVEKLGG